MQEKDNQRIVWWGWFVLPVLFNVIRLPLVLLVTAIPPHGPEADAGSMLWLVLIIVDFPVGYISLDLSNELSHIMAILVAVILGAIQWTMIGLAITWFFNFVIRTLSTD